MPLPVPMITAAGDVGVPVFANGIERVDWIASDGSLVAINDAGRAALGPDAERFNGAAWTELWLPKSQVYVAAHVALANVAGSTRFAAESNLGGRRIWWDVILSLAPGGLIAQSRDISDTMATLDEFRRRSLHDGLTGLLNRGALKDALELSIKSTEATGSAGAVILVDLDNFKLINDTLGHDVGDHVLQAVAAGLRDAVGDNGHTARLGGDEFALVLTDFVGTNQLHVMVEGLLERISRAVAIKGRTITPHASIGVALFPKDGTTPPELLKNADIALYAAKSFGRGGYVQFVPSMTGPIRRRAVAAAAVREALANDRVEACYQPMIDLDCGRLFGFEAKLQVILPDGRLMPVTQIVTVHEDVELAQALGERILTKVAYDAKAWRDNGLALTQIAVNACAAEFRDGNYARRFLAKIDEAGLAPTLFALEVAETVFASRGTDYVASALRTLSEAGVKISLDDFGTGPASLSHLKRLPVTGVKIDESFVEAVEHDAADGAVVRAMIGLAAGFGLNLAADGVNTSGQATMLATLGCTVGQGDLFGGASSADSAASMLTRYRLPA